MIVLSRTDSKNKDFVMLVKQLDAYLAVIDGYEHAYYAKLNTTSSLKYVVVAYENGKAVGCGAIREYTTDVMEVKRMYTLPDRRGEGIAAKVLQHLELWTQELLYKKCILETGVRQPDAISLYEKSGYRRIPNYGKYVGMEYSVCYEKEFSH